MLTLKTCTKCGETKDVVAFHRRVASPDGLQNLCAVCSKAYTRQWQVNNPTKVAALNAKYYVENADKVKLTSTTHRATNPEKCKTDHAKWRANNRDKIRVVGVKYRADNLEKIASRGVKYRAANPEKVKARSLKYYAENPEKYLANVAKRRAIKLNATPVWAEINSIKAIYADCPDGHHVDHYYPLKGATVCGLHVANNLQYLSAVENMRKGSKHPDTYMQQRGASV